MYFSSKGNFIEKVFQTISIKLGGNEVSASSQCATPVVFLRNLHRWKHYRRRLSHESQAVAPRLRESEELYLLFVRCISSFVF